MIPRILDIIEAVKRGDYLCATICASRLLAEILEQFHPPHPIYGSSGDESVESLADQLESMVSAEPNGVAAGVDGGLILPVLLLLLRKLLERL